MVGKFPDIGRFKKVAREFIVLELNPFLIDLQITYFNGC
ncbi:MAG: hypothetical protein TQ35_0008610 [Candidatus Aramenus sulfurataquae]|jgi:hypothetical protein|uniref:Uncharacterized protein n=1 Tax=Candidatus Aramenus sulfurataquae TaxID=1326980 RepID=A0ACC6TR84_9CREN